MKELPSNLIEMLVRTAARTGDARGIRFYDSPSASSFLGFGELDSRARSVASALTERGLRPGDVVVVALNSGFDFYDAFFGALFAELIVAPVAVTGIGTAATTGRIAGIVADSGAQLILTEQAVVDALREGPGAGGLGRPMVTVAELREAGDASTWTAPSVETDTTAVLLYTSGSTGNPKGVVMTHRNAIVSAEVSRRLVDTEPEPVLAGWIPMHHAMGLLVEVLVPCLSGTNAFLTSPAQFQRRPVFPLQLMSDNHATWSVAGNFAFDLCTQFATDEQLAALDLSGMTAFLTGSEPVRAETVRRFVDRFGPAGIRSDMIMPAYGCTEAMWISTEVQGSELVVLRVDADLLEAGRVEPATAARSLELVSCGVTVPFGTLAIVDPATEQRLPDRQVGEIWFAGPTVTPGYWRNPMATAEVFGKQLAGDDHSYLRTGDLGAIVDGELFITGRLKDLIIIRGRNVYPQDLEAAAARVHPSIMMGAAFELAGESSDVAILLEYDVERMPPELALDGLARDVRTALVREFSLPSLAVGFLPPGGVPRTPNGKVRRALSKTMMEHGELQLVHADGFVTTAP